LDIEYKNTAGKFYQKGSQTMVIQLSQQTGTYNGQLYRDVSYGNKSKANN